MLFVRLLYGTLEIELFLKVEEPKVGILAYARKLQLHLIFDCSRFTLRVKITVTVTFALIVGVDKLSAYPLVLFSFLLLPPSEVFGAEKCSH